MVKESTCNAGDVSLIPRWGRSYGEGNGNPLQYFCQGIPMERGAWQTTVHRVVKQDHRLLRASKEPNSQQGANSCLKEPKNTFLIVNFVLIFRKRDIFNIG